MPIKLNGSSSGFTQIDAASVAGNNTLTLPTASGTLMTTGGTNTFTANQVIEVTDNTNAALRITQLGTGNALLVEDSTNPDSSPFVVDASGNVGIGTSVAGERLSVRQDQNAQSRLALGNQDSGSSAEAALRLSAYGGSWDIANGSVAKNSNALTFSQVGGSERMRIDSSGNVGIGATPTAKLDVLGPSGVTSFTGTAKLGLTLRGATNSTEYLGINFAAIDGGVVARIGGRVTSSGSTIEFGTSNSYVSGVTNTAMMIDWNANVLVGATSSITGANTLQVVNAATDSTQIRVRNSGATAGQHWRYGTDSVNTIYIINHNSAGVYINNGGTSWSGLSDERAKDIIEPISDAASKVSTLRAVIGKYKTDEEGKRRSFLIAQDVQAVLPEAISVADQETGYLGLSYADTIPLLTAALQEALTKIDALEARIAALENA